MLPDHELIFLSSLTSKMRSSWRGTQPRMRPWLNSWLAWLLDAVRPHLDRTTSWPHFGWKKEDLSWSSLEAIFIEVVKFQIDLIFLGTKVKLLSFNHHGLFVNFTLLNVAIFSHKNKQFFQAVIVSFSLVIANLICFLQTITANFVVPIILLFNELLQHKPLSKRKISGSYFSD